ncbi:MAG: hypothetical protein CMB61_05455 [Euryarchaeota archaeon]|nr:hypothetical protein [Euryarchaeota archaeon]
MRKIAAIVLTLVILLPIQASSASDTLWDDARISSISEGTIGGISIDLTNTSTQYSERFQIYELPNLVEVYTATWCTNCVKTEKALDEAIGDSEVTRIHYHRYWYETIDPFGSNSTDERWVEVYGTGSTLSSETSYSSGMERIAPSNVFDGERMYTGISTHSNSLVTDYSTALSLGSSHPFSQNGSLTLEAERTSLANESPVYNVSWGYDLWWPDGTCNLVGWLLFVEETAYFPEGSNGKENYSHVLHHAVKLNPEAHQNFSVKESIEVIAPTPWDGDDMSVILILDWSSQQEEKSNSLPAPAVSALLLMLAALVPRRHKYSFEQDETPSMG